MLGEVSRSELTPERMDALLEHLPILRGVAHEPAERWEGGQKLPDGSLTLPYPVYRAEVLRFFEEAAEPWWTDYAYSPHAAAAMLDDPSAVTCASLDQIRSMLTYCLRGERFCDGHWESLIRSGKLTSLLERLAQLRPPVR